MYNRKLINYLPPFLREVKENKAILEDAENPEIVLMWESITETLDNQFIISANEKSISRWEKILKIVPKGTATVDERKFTILTKINEQLPFTVTTLNERLKALCGAGNYSLALDNTKYTLDVKVALQAKNNFDDVGALLERVVPANLVVTITLKYNQHSTFESMTYGELEAFTHYQLRNEVVR